MPRKQMFSKPIKKQTLSEQMAETIQQSILSGELESGAVLPTEPELAQQFGVSRAVVRDATRILMARGLVDVQHGRGVFVTQPQNEAFGEALLLALQRVGATAWDVEQFEQILLPEVVALTAIHASDKEIADLKQLVETYHQVIADYYTNWWGKESPPEAHEALRNASRQVMKAIFEATHNRVVQQLAQPLLGLRNLRRWADAEDETLEAAVERETGFMRQLVDAISSRDPDQARLVVSRLQKLPPEAVQAMQKTPVGEIPSIPIPVPRID